MDGREVFVSSTRTSPSSHTQLRYKTLQLLLIDLHSPTEAKMVADQMIGHKLITKQTGAAGRLCNAVYICERKFARREFYLAVLMDRQSQGPVIIASSQGGMDIETVAKESPDAIVTTHIDIHKGVTDDMGRNIATELGFSEQCIEDAKDTIQKLYKLFMEKDATQIEINPLSETSDHQVMAMDAKLTFDDNADFRQDEIFSWRDKTQEDADEVKAAEYAVPINICGTFTLIYPGMALISSN